MSTSHEAHINMGEDFPLNTIPGSGDAQNNRLTRQGAASCCGDKNNRKLAICSIICGISCIGIKALINSVKAETTTDPVKAAMFSKRAKKFGIIAIVFWVAILALTPILMALISYLLTLRD